MLSHEEMIVLQAEEHDLINIQKFKSKEEYVLHLIHTFAYVQASNLMEGKTVLDLGCNTGYGCEILSNSAKKVAGADVSENAIAIAKEKYGDLGIDFQVIDGKKLPYESNEFDIIVSFQVIEHIVDYNTYINELKRVLKPGGQVIFTTPNSALRLDPGMKPWYKFHVREFNADELETLLKTYFSAVKVLGLFANEPLYSIERNRLNQALERARKRIKKSGMSYYIYSLRSGVRHIIPSFIWEQLRTLLKSPLRSAAAIDENFVKEHGLKEFFHDFSDLNIALDLFAVCSDDENVMQEIYEKLKLKR